MAYYVDSSIQYRGYNTFRMEAPAKVKSWIFGVEGLETISHSFYAYATTALTGTIRTRTRWISGNGITLSVEDHTWTITEGGFFNHIKIEGITVPTGAVYAQLELHNTSGKTYWVGLIKSEAGDNATDFTHNLSGQLTRITASGIYTGTITAQQVILSSTTGENLPERLTTINSNMVQLTNKTSKNESDITTIKAGQITLESNINSVDGKLNTANSKITQIEAGKITLSSSTNGKIAGLTISSTVLRATSGGYGVQLSGSSGAAPLWIGNSSFTSPVFSVSWSGHLTANSATIKGTLKAGSIINGSLNNTTGRHNGTHYGYHEGRAYTSTDSTLAGSLSNTTGRHNGTHYGYYSGQASTYSNSTLGGYLSSTTGSHNGSIYSGSGSLGGVSFQTYSGTTVRLNGSMSLQYALLVYGNIHYQGSLNKMSDGTMKTDIKEAKPEDYLNSFYNMKLKNFAYRKDKEKKRQLGIIAQDFIKDNDNELIDLVVGANDGYLNVKYENLYLMNILATQELNERVKKLEEKVNERV